MILSVCMNVISPWHPKSCHLHLPVSHDEYHGAVICIPVLYLEVSNSNHG